MSHPFDATLKELVRRYPLDCSKLKTLKENLAMVDLRESSAYWLILEEGIAQGLAKVTAKG